jgi:hypothetical protein
LTVLLPAGAAVAEARRAAVIAAARYDSCLFYSFFKSLFKEPL